MTFNPNVGQVLESGEYNMNESIHTSGRNDLMMHRLDEYIVSKIASHFETLRYENMCVDEQIFHVNKL